MTERSRRSLWTAAIVAMPLLAGCGASSGIVAVAPDTYAATEMRAQAIGGGPRAQAALLAEAGSFCNRQGRSVALLDMRPGGDPRGYYWPTAFSATFRCVGTGGDTRSAAHALATR